MRRPDHFPDLDSERAPRTRHSGAASAESTAPLYSAGRMVKNKKTGRIKTASTAKRRRKVFTANDEEEGLGRHGSWEPQREKEEDVTQALSLSHTCGRTGRARTVLDWSCCADRWT
jgi:hypothetical protein